ncbi:Calcineurin-like phosphoesterase [Williamsia serinedens]|uniref:Calcineurin-like phosphoesterase n=1 Tax=Williamsia serinedens TaxID=391736 RepID=A0ABT1H0R4_9NOCA|nr:Calcineurin-like phosphoesterase [Williamsia serinedens]
MSRVTVIAHISDLHVTGDAARRSRICAVVDHVNARADGIDVLVVTGDITDDGTPAQNTEAAEILGAARVPTLVIPGNHDRRPEFSRALLAGAATDLPLNRSATVAGVLYLMCDSTIPGRDDGWLSDASLGWMESEIVAAGADTPVVVCFHHPPVTLGMPFMDGIRQIGEDRLADLIARHPNVVGSLCGHAHTGAVTTFAGRPLVIAPGVSATLKLPFEGEGIVDATQPAGIAFHQLDGFRLITHFRSVV